MVPDIGSPAEVDKYIRSERIKAYIYFGIDAEMDFIEEQTYLKQIDEKFDGDLEDVKNEKQYTRRKIEIAQAKIGYVNIMLKKQL